MFSLNPLTPPIHGEWFGVVSNVCGGFFAYAKLEHLAQTIVDKLNEKHPTTNGNEPDYYLLEVDEEQKNSLNELIENDDKFLKELFFKSVCMGYALSDNEDTKRLLEIDIDHF